MQDEGVGSVRKSGRVESGLGSTVGVNTALMCRGIRAADYFDGSEEARGAASSAVCAARPRAGFFRSGQFSAV